MVKFQYTSAPLKVTKPTDHQVRTYCTAQEAARAFCQCEQKPLITRPRTEPWKEQARLKEKILGQISGEWHFTAEAMKPILKNSLTLHRTHLMQNFHSKINYFTVTAPLSARSQKALKRLEIVYHMHTLKYFSRSILKSILLLSIYRTPQIQRN